MIRNVPLDPGSQCYARLLNKHHVSLAIKCYIAQNILSLNYFKKSSS